MRTIITNSFERQENQSKSKARYEKCSNLKPYVLGKLKTIRDNLAIISHTSSFVQLSIIIPIAITLTFYTRDYSSDFSVASIYSFCNFFIEPTNVTYTYRENRFHSNFMYDLSDNFILSAIVMLIIFISSVLTVVPSIVSIKHLFECKQFMVTINNEKQNNRFPPEKFLTRHNLSQMESSFEGSLQLIVQSFTSLSTAWILTWVEQVVLNFR